MNTGPRTLPALLADQAARRPRAVALRRKSLGVWKEWTWAEYLAWTARIGTGLGASGLAAGDAVVLAGDAAPELLACALGAMGAGAVVVPADPAAPAEDLVRVVEAVGAGMAVVLDKEQFDKLSAVEHLTVVVVDPRGIDGPGVVPLAEVVARGAEQSPDAWVEAARRLAPGAAALAGGDGEQASHEALLREGSAFVEEIGGSSRDELLSFLPLSVPSERGASLAGAMVAGWTVNFAERDGSLTGDLRELQPTVVVGVAGLWEAMAADAGARLRGAGGIKGLVSRWALSGGPGGVRDLLVHRPARAKLGLGRLRAGLSVDRMPAPEALELLAAIGVTVRPVGRVREGVVT